MCGTKFEHLPKIEVPASVPTKIDRYNEEHKLEPTPKVMPYELDDTSAKEQLRMRSGERRIESPVRENPTSPFRSQSINRDNQSI
jgi:hypothetical protein